MLLKNKNSLFLKFKELFLYIKEVGYFSKK